VLPDWPLAANRFWRPRIGGDAGLMPADVGREMAVQQARMREPSAERCGFAGLLSV
jgi:hypothetical protein